MDSYDIWSKALKNTEIIRPRVQGLMTFTDTVLPYILLSESSVNVGDTAVRSGEVILEKPSLILPPHAPQFQGFDFSRDDPSQDEAFINFLFVRGIRMPSLKYCNRTVSLDIYDGRLSEAIRFYHNQLQQNENVHAGLVSAPEDCWQFSLLIYVCSQIVRNADSDIRRLIDEFKKKQAG